MKWLNWNSSKKIFLIFIQMVLFAILLRPWLSFATDQQDFSLELGLFLLVSMVLVGIMVPEKTNKTDKRSLIIFIVGLLCLTVVSFMCNLPLSLFLPLGSLGFLWGVRFHYYPRSASFTQDWSWGSLVLILTAIIGDILGFKLTLVSVLTFFALGVFGVILWNGIALEREGLNPFYRGLGRSVFFFVLVVVLLSLFLGLLLSPTFFVNVLNFLRKIQLVMAEVLTFIIGRPLALMSKQLYQWLEGKKLQPQTIELPDFDREKFALDHPQSEINPVVIESLPWIMWFLLLVILGIFSWIIIKRLPSRRKAINAATTQETRESVYYKGQVYEDFKQALQKIVKPLSRLRRTRWYKGDDPILTIRAIYARFVLLHRKKTPFKVGSTPDKYAQKLLRKNSNINEQSIQTLTDYYNNARYGEQADAQAVSQSRKAFRES